VLFKICNISRFFCYSRKLWSRDVEWPLGRGFYYHVITGRHVWTSDQHDASGEGSA